LCVNLTSLHVFQFDCIEKWLIWSIKIEWIFIIGGVTGTRREIYLHRSHIQFLLLSLHLYSATAAAKMKVEIDMLYFLEEDNYWRVDCEWVDVSVCCAFGRINIGWSALMPSHAWRPYLYLCIQHTNRGTYLSTHTELWSERAEDYLCFNNRWPSFLFPSLLTFIEHFYCH